MAIQLCHEIEAVLADRDDVQGAWRGSEGERQFHD
jgi:hypothetical protein